jgi:C-terminal processing protease CtpA/Prc
MQSTIPFTNGGTLTLTTALYNPPSGNNFNGVGVMPDIPVAEGEDVTAAAITYLKTKIN